MKMQSTKTKVCTFYRTKTRFLQKREGEIVKKTKQKQNKTKQITAKYNMDLIVIELNETNQLEKLSLRKEL